VTILLVGLAAGLTAGRSGEEDSKFESPPADAPRWMVGGERFENFTVVET
jgi:hypothetical protein